MNKKYSYYSSSTQRPLRDGRPRILLLGWSSSDELHIISISPRGTADVAAERTDGATGLSAGSLAEDGREQARCRRDDTGAEVYSRAKAFWPWCYAA